MNDIDEEITQRILDDLLQPPEGLTLREQARWWLSHPVELQMALLQKEITPDVWEECICVAKDNDLAMKIADPKKVNGLGNEERKRLLFLLTDGGELGDPRQGRPSKVLTDLRIANSIRDISDFHTRERALRDAVIADSGVMADDSIYRRMKRIEKLWVTVEHFKPEVIDLFLRNSTDKDDFSNDQLIRLLELCAYIQDQFSNPIRK